MKNEKSRSKFLKIVDEKHDINFHWPKQNINLFLPEHYANIADVLLVKIQLNLIKNSYILNINIHTLKNIKNIGGVMIYPLMLCACGKKTRHQSVSRAHCGNYSFNLRP
jgi:hypothetical protein